MAAAAAAADFPQDFPLGKAKAMRVRDILCEQTIPLRNWVEITDYFLTSPADKLIIERMIEQNTNMQIVVLRTLELWIEREREEATFDACIEILNQRGFFGATRKLEDQRLGIRSIRDSHVVSGPDADDPRHDTLFHKVPMLGAYFTGRATALATIHEKITLHGRLLVLSGLGGVGKTTLATAYAHQMALNFYEVVIWIDAKSKESMTKSFRDLGSNLSLDGPNLASLVTKIYSKFKVTKTLFVFDNANEFKGNYGIFNFFSKLSYSSAHEVPHVLVTTRQLGLIISAQNFQLQIFDNSEAIEFLCKWIQIEPDPADDPQIVHLVQTLSCLPLALEQAGAYMRREQILHPTLHSSTIVANYLREYKQNAKAVLNDTTFQQSTLSSYERTTLVTWLVTLERVKGMSGGRLAVELLQMLAYFEPTRIPIEFFVLVGESETWTTFQSMSTYFLNFISVLNILLFRHDSIPYPSTSADSFWAGPDSRRVIESLEPLTIYSMVSHDESFINIHSVVQDVLRVHAAKRQFVILRTLLKTLDNVHNCGTSFFKFPPFVSPRGYSKWVEFKNKVRPHFLTLAMHAIRYTALVRQFPRIFESVSKDFPLHKP